MQTEIAPTQNSRFKTGWALLIFVAFIQALSALFLWISSGPAGFEADTGVAWTELAQEFPTVAMQFAMTQQSSLVTTLAAGLLALAILMFAFRGGQRWAWFALWILPASMVPGTISLARTDNQAGIAVFGSALILLAIVGLLLSFRAFFNK